MKSQLEVLGARLGQELLRPLRVVGPLADGAVPPQALVHRCVDRVGGVEQDPLDDRVAVDA
jgi:hypothetical protein